MAQETIEQEVIQKAETVPAEVNAEVVAVVNRIHSLTEEELDKAIAAVESKVAKINKLKSMLEGWAITSIHAVLDKL
jgi:hypothetical protein